MDNKDSFSSLVDKAMKIEGRTHMRPVIEKELLHYDILFILDKADLLDNITFQGGTSLRLCYGASRFSEDLDFAGGKNFTTSNLINMKKCIEEYLGTRYELEVSVKEPNDFVNESKYQQIKVSKWQIRITTHPERKELPKQMIKIEVVNIPAHTREPRLLQHNYDFLPDGYNDTLIMVETLDEILSDKLISLINSNHIRHRDIWDIYWLKQKNISTNIELIKLKIVDYKISNYTLKIDEMLSQIPDIILGKDFREQMKRFLPTDVQERTIMKEKFYPFLKNEILGLLENVKSQL